ncbi:MAG: DUF86 domain-containing protein [Candidatus Cloacimonadota bacterium]|nr:DUF86 domain-containing protein [Candidatus Cloacimonadota bacterium]
MSKREYRLFIDDIIESIELIDEYILGMDFEKFKNDRKTIDAVVRNLEIIGEASNNIPASLRDKYSDIDWSGIIGLRNRIAHEYFGISLSIIWNISTRELLIFKDQIIDITKDIS